MFFYRIVIYFGSESVFKKILPVKLISLSDGNNKTIERLS